MRKVLNVFISYSHKDKNWKEMLIPHLNSLIRQKKIRIWYDNLIIPGQKINREVMKYLHESQIIILLISADYLASSYCYDIELKEAMQMKSQDMAEVIPVVVRPVDLKGTPIDNLKSLPEDRKAVSLFQNEDEAMEDVAQGIRRVVENWGNRGKMEDRIFDVPGADEISNIQGKEEKGVGTGTIYNNWGYKIQDGVFINNSFTIHND